MKLFNLNDFKGGWFIGDFVPTIIPSKEVEVSIKHYRAGEHDQKHVHKVADEVTVIVEGMVEMNGVKYHSDDVIWIEKGDETDFTAITEAITCVIKIPSVKGDKYLV